MDGLQVPGKCIIFMCDITDIKRFKLQREKYKIRKSNQDKMKNALRKKKVSKISSSNKQPINMKI